MKTVRAKAVAWFTGILGLAGQGWAEPTPIAPGAGLAAQDAQRRSRLVALRVVGSSVKNPQGEYLGRIEEAAVNPGTGQIEFAMLQIYYPTSTTRVTPVPWKVLTYVWDQSQEGGTPGAVQTFNLNMSRAQLERAPTIDRNRWPNLGEAYWAQRIFAYYGVQAEGMFATSGTGAAPQAGPEAAVPYASYEPSPYVGAGATGESVVTSDGSMTNAGPFIPIPPGATNKLFNTNIFLNRTNFFQNRTNFFPGTRTPFNSENPSTFPQAAGGTNSATRFPGQSNFPGVPAPRTGNSPWSPQFADPNTPNLPVQPQPNPWSPRFISPDPSAPSVPANPQPNPWTPRFSAPSADPPGVVGSAGFAPPNPAVAPPNSAFAPPASMAPPPPPPMAAPRAPVMRAPAPAPARRR